MAKSIYVKENQRRAEAAEGMMIRIGKAVNDNICHLGKDITKTHELLEVIYDFMQSRTLKGRFKALVKWIGTKR